MKGKGILLLFCLSDYLKSGKVCSVNSLRSSRSLNLFLVLIKGLLWMQKRILEDSLFHFLIVNASWSYCSFSGPLLVLEERTLNQSIYALKL